MPDTFDSALVDKVRTMVTCKQVHKLIDGFFGDRNAKYRHHFTEKRILESLQRSHGNALEAAVQLLSEYVDNADAFLAELVL